MVLPLLFEDHVQALQNGVVFPRVARAVGGMRFRSRSFALAPAIDSRTSFMRSTRRSSTWSSDGSASGSMPQRRGLVSHDPPRPHGWYGWVIPFTIRRSQQSVARTR